MRVWVIHKRMAKPEECRVVKVFVASIPEAIATLQSVAGPGAIGEAQPYSVTGPLCVKALDNGVTSYYLLEQHIVEGL